MSNRSGRVRLAAVAVVMVVVAIVALVAFGAVRDIMTPGSGDTADATPSPAASASAAGSPASSGAPADASPASTSAPAQPSAPSGPPAGASSSAAAPAPTAAALVAVGDIARCDANGDEQTAALAASLPGTITTLGDTAYPKGSSKDLDGCFTPSWGPLMDRITWAVYGNHDYMTDKGTPLAVYMGSRAVRDGKTYYSDTLGAWHVVVLDANCGDVDGGCGASSPQVAWLKADLAAHPAACTVALYHQPRWSSGYHGNTRSLDAIWTTLADNGVDLVLNGHEHDYERFEPLDASGAPDAAGTTEIVVGTGGGDLRGFRSRPQEGSVVRKSTVYGVLDLALGDGSWTYRFVDVAGNVLDQGTGTCH